MREIDKRVINSIISVWLMMGVFFHLYTAAFGVYEAWLQRLIHLTWVFPIAFLRRWFSRFKNWDLRA